MTGREPGGVRSVGKAMELLSCLTGGPLSLGERSDVPEWL